jgi:hypothetical protein
MSIAFRPQLPQNSHYDWYRERGQVSGIQVSSGVVPVPERRAVLGESVALLLSETVPPKVPVPAGVKGRLKDVL